MSNPIFSQSIAELKPIPDFIREPGGIWNLPMQLHLGNHGPGCAQLPDSAGVADQDQAYGSDRHMAECGDGARRTPIANGPRGKEKDSIDVLGDESATKRKAIAIDRRRARSTGWRLSPFRLLLFLAFSILSLQATRNSHQFAAVVGTITAWNFGEWAAIPSGDAPARPVTERARSDRLAPRPIAFGAVTPGALLGRVGPVFTEMTGEGRTIGLGEDPLWFPHEAAQFAGQPGMPDRFLSFHNGHASLFEYYHGPERKVYTDPRLEVAGADLFRGYTDLEKRIRKDTAGLGGRSSMRWAVRSSLWTTNITGKSARRYFAAPNGAASGSTPSRRCSFMTHTLRSSGHMPSISRPGISVPIPSMESRGTAELAASRQGLQELCARRWPARGRARPAILWLGLDDARRCCGESRTRPMPGNSWARSSCLANSQPSRSHGFASRLTRFSICRWYVRPMHFGVRSISRLATSRRSDRLQIAYDFRLMTEAVLPVLDSSPRSVQSTCTSP